MEVRIETKIANGFPISLPSEKNQFRDKFVLRLPKTLHTRLAHEAEREGIPLTNTRFTA